MIDRITEEITDVITSSHSDADAAVLGAREDGAAATSRPHLSAISAISRSHLGHISAQSRSDPAPAASYTGHPAP